MKIAKTRELPSLRSTLVLAAINAHIPRKYPSRDGSDSRRLGDRVQTGAEMGGVPDEVGEEDRRARYAPVGITRVALSQRPKKFSQICLKTEGG